MKSFIISVFISLLYSRLTAGVAILSSPAIEITPANSSTLAGDRDTTHCSNDRASYGQIRPGDFACLRASYNLFHCPRITNTPYNYPIDFVSSTAPLPALGHNLRTPWRSTHSELTIDGHET